MTNDVCGDCGGTGRAMFAGFPCPSCDGVAETSEDAKRLKCLREWVSGPGGFGDYRVECEIKRLTKVVAEC